MTPEGAPGGVVLLHGLANNAAIMRPMAAHLQAHGHETLNLSYPSLTRSMIGIVDQLVPRIDIFADQLGGPVHFVGHSLGGLVIRAYLARTRPRTLGRVVMVGTPNQGSELADLAIRLRVGRLALGRVGPYLMSKRAAADDANLGTVDYPLGVIAGRRAAFPYLFNSVFSGAHDGKVSVAATMLTGMTDHIVVPIPHAALPRARVVIEQTTLFLSEGRFAGEKVSN